MPVWLGEMLEGFLPPPSAANPVGLPCCPQTCKWLSSQVPPPPPLMMGVITLGTTNVPSPTPWSDTTLTRRPSLFLIAHPIQRMLMRGSLPWATGAASTRQRAGHPRLGPESKQASCEMASPTAFQGLLSSFLFTLRCSANTGSDVMHTPH